MQTGTSSQRARCHACTHFSLLDQVHFEISLGNSSQKRMLGACRSGPSYLLQPPTCLWPLTRGLPLQLRDDYLRGGSHGSSQRSAPLEEDGEPPGRGVCVSPRSLAGASGQWRSEDAALSGQFFPPRCTEGSRPQRHSRALSQSRSSAATSACGTRAAAALSVPRVVPPAPHLQPARSPGAPVPRSCTAASDLTSECVRTSNVAVEELGAS